MRGEGQNLESENVEPNFAEITAQNFGEFAATVEYRHDNGDQGITDDIKSIIETEKFFDKLVRPTTSENLNLETVRALSAWLLGAKGQGRAGGKNIEYPIKNMIALEVGGYSHPAIMHGAGWSSAVVFNNDGVDITCIDKSVPDSDLTEVGHVDPETKKIQELMRVDVLQLEENESLRERKYNLIFGVRFLGYPTSGDEKQILTVVARHLVHGGIALFIVEADEAVDISENDADDDDLEMIVTHYLPPLNRVIYVFRKI